MFEKVYSLTLLILNPSQMRRELFNGTNIWGTIHSASHFPKYARWIVCEERGEKKG